MPVGDLRTNLSVRLAARHARLFEAMHTEAYRIANDVIENGPVDTGASRGSPAAPRGPHHKSQPLAIGNEIGMTGWQVTEVANTPAYGKIAVGTPMWDRYLKYVEYGFLHARTDKDVPAQFFLRAAWMSHTERIKVVYAPGH